MAEQESRRSNRVTSAGFENPFETHAIRFGSGSLNLKDSLDAMEGWSRLTNIWHENEGEATSRPGQTQLGTHGAGPVHSVRKLRTPATGGMTRVWGVGSQLQVGPANGGTVDSGYSGDPLALVPHRPALSGDSWMYVGDRARMRKVRSDGLVLPIGLPIPTAAVTVALGTEYRTDIAQCEAADTSAAVSWTGSAGTDEDGNVSGVPIAEDTQDHLETIDKAVRFRTTDGSGAFADTPGDVYDSWWGLHRTRDLTVLTPVGGGATRPASDEDFIHFWMVLSLPYLIEEVRLYFVVSPDFDETVLPGTDGETMKNQDAYVKSFRRADFAPYVAAKTAQITNAEVARVHRLRDDDLADRSARERAARERAAQGHPAPPGYTPTGHARLREEATDPGRTSSMEMIAGSYQWFEFGAIGTPLRRGDFQRLGVDPLATWATVTGIVLYVRTAVDAVNRVVVLAIDDLYLTGGSGPDSSEPGAQPYDYRATNYDPRTGAESNGSVEMTPTTTYIDSLRRDILVDPPAYGDAAVRQRIYRRGGSLIDDWYYAGENDGDGSVFTDRLTDAEVAAAGTLPTDNYQPVPTLDRITGDTVLAQPVPGLWGPLEGMLMACGDPHRPGHLYYSNPNQPEHWSAFGNVEVCAPSEELMNGGVVGHQGFVFSRTKLYTIYPNLTGLDDVSVTPSLCTRGLIGRWAFCVGPGGIVYFVAEDGVFATQGGPEEWISEKINPLFYGAYVKGYAPIDKNQSAAIRLTVWENCLYFQYQDQDDGRQVMVYSILQKHWRHYHFGRAPAVVQGEDEEVLVIGDVNGGSYTHEGTSDAGLGIECVIRTGSESGGKREEKLFGDLFLDADPDLAQLTLQVFLNEEAHANVEEAISTFEGRQRYIVHAFGISPQKAHSIACELRWTDHERAPILYQVGYAITLQPDLTNTRVTNWDDLNSPDEVWLTGLTLDVDTGGASKTFHVERDFGGERLLVATFDVTSNNRHKFKYSWPAVPANQVRIRPEANECEPWLLYRADWIYQQEPPRISKWDIHFENQWDQYYTGLDLYCDTFGQEKRIEVYVDGARLDNTLAGLPYWPISTSSRQVVHLTLPWGRGHVFRFIAIDENPGLLYTHRWHLAAEPSEQANWNQNFSILGTRADKWLKAIIFECDTFDQDKAVEIQVDGVTVETLTVHANGRRVIQLALSQQALGRVWRMFPVDANPGRLYSAEPLFDEEPFQLNRWETQETNHGLTGWFYPLYAHITVKSTADVTLTTVMQHNQVGGQTTRTYLIPSTGGVKQRRFLHGFVAGKGVLIKYVLTSATPFWLYRDETSVVIQPWGAENSIVVKPFGNDDLDPSRPMTHAELAAQTSGGAAGTAGMLGALGGGG